MSVKKCCGGSCSCNDAGPALIFPCSGCSDTGSIADQAGRKLTQQNKGSMACLAGIGGRVSGILLSTKAAERILVIDGCPLGCGAQTLKHAGIRKFMHLELSTIGLKKGKSPLNRRNLQKAIVGAEKLLSGKKR